MATRIHADLAHEIERALRGGPLSSAQLTAALGISQPTLSRTIQNLRTVTPFRISGERTPRYGLLRQLPKGLDPRQRIYRYLGRGNIEPFADVEFLAGGGTLERIGGPGGTTRLYAGLPPYVAFAAPSGFLGRQLAQQAASSQQFPVSLSDWNDDHKVAYLFTQGLNLSGNLVFGDICLQTEIAFRAVREVPTEDKAEFFVHMAGVLKNAPYGSSAGGEQPKFLARTADTGQVIVKFAKLGTRMAELLPLEHLALRTLGELNVPASRTHLLVAGDYVFLEVERFDRTPSGGRIGMLSAGSVDDEFFGQRGSWSEFAARCVQARYLKPQDAFWVDTMAAFSELIGNGDRHFENISMLIGDDSEYLGIAPAYDILPMRYASIGGGMDPDLNPIEPKIGTIGAKPDVWTVAAKAAQRFWTAAQTEEFAAPLSPAMKELAAKNLAVAMAFVEPLLPAATEPEANPARRPRVR
jgi:hypothetical protein